MRIFPNSCSFSVSLSLSGEYFEHGNTQMRLYRTKRVQLQNEIQLDKLHSNRGAGRGKEGGREKGQLLACPVRQYSILAALCTDVIKTLRLLRQRRQWLLIAVIVIDKVPIVRLLLLEHRCISKCVHGHTALILNIKDSIIGGEWRRHSWACAAWRSG